uniref:Uncharacterized protein n=1 Tax=viral metagenome TaxID=1070528 RepID=A0A6C0H3B0_9ZZZZ
MKYFRGIFFILCSIIYAKEGRNLRGVNTVTLAGGWQSFPTPAPRTVKQNPNVKCAIQTFGRCNSGEYCKSISYDKYRCTSCPKNKRCTGDGKMGPP